ncbi:hypothetical protein E4U43_002762 [Claviceps pusilla]|uniref:Uncharacterized protein n=1 Tax=Claviceps pusilla TaxID=123648 RepID=A0A9P7N717_9HYPO|nr:hypothetical protein E4U43_002762 [Claviceps pusilla]
MHVTGEAEHKLESSLQLPSEATPSPVVESSARTRRTSLVFFVQNTTLFLLAPKTDRKHVLYDDILTASDDSISQTQRNATRRNPRTPSLLSLHEQPVSHSISALSP